jgi:GT2 family glycosyltransferase
MTCELLMYPSGADPVFVVIVNCRTGPLTVECLASLSKDIPALRRGRVIVIDDASGDGSVTTNRARYRGTRLAAASPTARMPEYVELAYWIPDLASLSC